MPKPGEGGKLLRIVRQIRAETANAGFPPLTIYTQTHGPHGMVVTEQQWESLAAYESSRDQFTRRRKQILDGATASTARTCKRSRR